EGRSLGDLASGSVAPGPLCSLVPGFATSPARGLRQRHADGEVIAGRVIVVAAALVVLAVDTDAVQQVALLRRAVDQRLAAEQVARNLGQVLRRQLVQLRRVATVLAAIRRQGERDPEVRVPLLGALNRLL